MMSLFGVCLVFWLLLSGHWDAFYVAAGGASALLVAWLNRDEEVVSDLVRVLPGLGTYVPWLLWQILLANVQVLRIVLHPRLPIDPEVVRVRPPAGGDLVVAALANSITLTPGTVTLDVEDGELVVHALTPGAARSLEGPMARRVARAFGEAGA